MCDAKRKIYFVLSVDTEEEFDWSGAFPQTDCSVSNVKQLPKFQAFCESLGVRPTYLVDYPVAYDKDAAVILRSFVQSGMAEVGAHLHPWCNPPLTQLNTERESHVINLSSNLVADKLDILTRIIQENIGVKPSVFRTGRWGISGEVLEIVKKAGYLVDSSVFPYYENSYFSCANSPVEPYWPDLADPIKMSAQREVLELPVSAGFNRKNFKMWSKVHKVLSGAVFRKLRIIGLMWRLNILRKVYLSPELSSLKDMLALTRTALANNHQVIHMFIHSSSLLPGNVGYAGGNTSVEELYAGIRGVVEDLIKKTDVVFCTMSECKKHLHNDVVEP